MWSPRAVADIGRELSPQQELACALRVLAAVGFSESFAGHITVVDQTTGRMWANPWGIWWSEAKASDICVIDVDGVVVEGNWDVTPAIAIHTELHRARPDAVAVVHNHPYHVRLLAATGALPLALHQTGSLFHDDVCWVDEYDGEVRSAGAGRSLAESIGRHNVAILANHGAIVAGRTLREAVFRAANLDEACRLTWDATAPGRSPRKIEPVVQAAIRQTLLGHPVDAYWAGAVRQLLAREPDVLE